MQDEARPQIADGSVVSIDATAEAPFYIATTGPSARPRRMLNHADTFAVFDSHGDTGASAGGADGLFDRDTRSGIELARYQRYFGTCRSAASSLQFAAAPTERASVEAHCKQKREVWQTKLGHTRKSKSSI